MSTKPRKNYRETNNKRIILNPNKLGCALPLIPIFAGLSAFGSLASGTSAVYNAYNTHKKRGNGFYLNPSTGG